MTSLVGWVFITIGIVYLISISALFAPIRVALARTGWFLEALLYCPVCTSYWVGCTTAVAEIHDFLPNQYMWNILFSGFAAMGLMLVVFQGVMRGVNPAWEAEAGLRAQKDNNDDAATSREEVESHDAE